jgi:hypothetical protein
MKVNKYLLNVVIAIIGGLIAVFTYTLIVDNKQVVKIEEVKPTFFTGNT